MHRHIAISSWSFHNQFERTRDAGTPDSLPLIDLLDFPEMMADRFHVHAIEAVSTHFTSTEPIYLEELRTRLERAHSTVVNIPADIGQRDVAALSSKDAAERARVVDAYTEWIAIASTIGAPAVRCDPGTFELTDLGPAIESYRELVARGQARGVEIIVENHGAMACGHPAELAAILRASGAGALPDIGNWPDEDRRSRGLRLMFPLAKVVCHAKRNPERFDLAAYLRLAQELGYTGAYSVEAGGKGDPYAATAAILEDLRAD